MIDSNNRIDDYPSCCQVDSTRRELGDAAGFGMANAVAARLPARQETAAVDWVFGSMGEASEWPEVKSELELEESFEEVGLLAEDALVR